MRCSTSAPSCNRGTGPSRWPICRAALLPRKGSFGLLDYEKVFTADPVAGDVFTTREIDRDRGCLVVVRPDQYVAHIVDLDAHEELVDFLTGVFREVDHPARSGGGPPDDGRGR